MAKVHQAEEIINQRYKIARILGKGGVGITYSAIDLKTNSAVAIKAVSLRQLNNWKQIELFERETKILQQLNHSSIPKYIDRFQVETEDNFDFYIVQELAPGESLAALIDFGWRPDKKTVSSIAEQILDILVYLQSLNPPVIHRDIKPQNIIYQPDTDKLFLVDFGAVKDTYHNTIIGSTVVGTYGYMAPEQYRGNAMLSTDLYGLGCTLLFLLTGQSPAEIPQRKLRIDFRSVVEIERNFADWLEKLIEPDLDYRFQNAQDAFDVLAGDGSLENYKINRVEKPNYTSVYFTQEKNKSFVIIPPALFWNKHSFACLTWLSYYAFVIINIALLSLANSWLGYVYGFIVILEFFANWILAKFLYIVNIIYLFASLITIVFIRSELIQLIPILIIAFDTVLLHRVRIKIVKDCLFPTRLKIINNSLANYLKLERKVFGLWHSEANSISYRDINPAMNIKLNPILSKLNFDYKFGYLLSLNEKKWLQEKLRKRL